MPRAGIANVKQPRPTKDEAIVIATLVLFGHASERKLSRDAIANESGLDPLDANKAIAALEERGVLVHIESENLFGIRKRFLGRKSAVGGAHMMPDSFFAEFKRRWNEIAPRIGVSRITPKNLAVRKCVGRLDLRTITIDDIITALERAAKDKFLMGENNDSKRYLTLEYITRPDRFAHWFDIAQDDLAKCDTTIDEKIYLSALAERVVNAETISQLPKPPAGAPREFTSAYQRACDELLKRALRKKLKEASV